MEPVHVKKALSPLDRVHLFAIQNEGDGSLQHEIEGIINMVEGITIVQKNTHQFYFIFSSLSVFYNMFMLYWSLSVKSFFILNTAYFLSLFVRKYLHIMIQQKM